MQRQSYPYCKHGSYVGGCGADYMCGACEMGDETPSLRDLTNEVSILLDRFAREDDNLRASLVENYPHNIYLHVYIYSHMLQHNTRLRHIENVRQQIEYITPLVTGMDDRGWLDREHDRKIREWDSMEGEDQFWSLPSQVLDGP